MFPKAWFSDLGAATPNTSLKFGIVESCEVSLETELHEYVWPNNALEVDAPLDNMPVTVATLKIHDKNW